MISTFGMPASRSTVATGSGPMAMRSPSTHHESTPLARPSAITASSATRLPCTSDSTPSFTAGAYDGWRMSQRPARAMRLGARELGAYGARDGSAGAADEGSGFVVLSAGGSAQAAALVLVGDQDRRRRGTWAARRHARSEPGVRLGAGGNDHRRQIG